MPRLTRVPLALGLLVAFALAPPAGAETLKPVQALNWDFGAKHVTGYYLAQGGACAMTLLVDDGFEAREAQNLPILPPARLRFALAPGGSAKLDTPGVAPLVMTCGPNAEHVALVTTPAVAVAPAEAVATARVAGR